METAGLENRDLVSIAADMFQFPGHRTTVCLEGSPIEVSQGGVWSLLDVVVEREGKMSFVGWAADKVTLEPADSILLFADGDLVYQGMNRHPRPDAAEYYKEDDLEQSGFHLKLDPETLPGEKVGPQLRRFRRPNLRVGISPQFSMVGRADFDAGESALLPLRATVFQWPGGAAFFPSSIAPSDRTNAGDSMRTTEFLAGLRELAWEAGPDGLFNFGPSESLSGKRLNRLQVTGRRGLRIELDHPELYETVRLDSDFIPAAVEGWISVADVEFVAVSVNGTLHTVAPTFDGLDGRRRFQALVPESAFRNGSNRVRTFAVAQTEEGVMLHTPLEN